MGQEEQPLRTDLRGGGLTSRCLMGSGHCKCMEGKEAPKLGGGGARRRDSPFDEEPRRHRAVTLQFGINPGG